MGTLTLRNMNCKAFLIKVGWRHDETKERKDEKRRELQASQECRSARPSMIHAQLLRVHWWLLG